MLLFSTNNISGTYLIVFIQDIDKTIRSKNSGKNLANFLVKFLLVVQNTFRGTRSHGQTLTPPILRGTYTHQENIFMELFIPSLCVFILLFSSVQLLSCVRLICDSHGLQHSRLLCPTPTPGDRVGDAIQPSHTLSSPSPPAFNLPQHQGHFIFTSVIFKVCIFAYLAHHENLLKGN